MLYVYQIEYLKKYLNQPTQKILYTHNSGHGIFDENTKPFLCLITSLNIILNRNETIVKLYWLRSHNLLYYKRT